ncbi:MAG: arylamine N-acetyltransferase [Gammaproteobacteria bacterium]|nr:arylamine N-acetyltransferase [Gammaproteobacteria bacterium]
MSDRVDLVAYAERLGFSGALEPSLETLRTLHRLHPAAIPFENLTTLLDESPRLDVPSLEAKLVHSGRGGYCFEHNRLFAAVLEALGFRVVGLAARVLWERDPSALPPRTHMLLTVDVEGSTYVADVGFGGLTLTAPLRLVVDEEQDTPHETYRIRRQGTGFVIEARLGGTWRALYWFDETPYHEIDFEVLNHFVATHPGSPFRSMLYCARALPERRLALRNGRFTVRDLEGRPTTRTLADVDALRGVLAEDFAIDLPDDPALDDVLREVLDADEESAAAERR